MKKTFFILLLFLISARLFSADTTPQKITLSLNPKNVFYSIDILLQKTILGVSAGNKDIILLPAGKENLDVLDIKQINASLLLKTKRTGDSYTVEISSVDTITNLIDNSVQFKANKLAPAVTTAAKALFDIILSKYPPKPVQELKTIELVKVGVSEFETMNPAFSVQILPLFTFSEIEVELMLSNSSSFNNKGIFSRPFLFSPQAEILFQYRSFLARADLGYTFGNLGGKQSYAFSSGIMAGFGLFQSLIVLGIDSLLDTGQFQSPDSINTNTPPTSPSYVAMPSVSYFSFNFGFYFRFNLTHDYYFESSVGIPGFGLSSINVNFTDPNLKIKSGGMNDTYSKGPPFMKIRFTWRVWNQLHVILHYSASSVGFQGNFNESNKPVPPVLNESLGIYLKTVSISQYKMGLGLMYEF